MLEFRSWFQIERLHGVPKDNSWKWWLIGRKCLCKKGYNHFIGSLWWNSYSVAGRRRSSASWATLKSRRVWRAFWHVANWVLQAPRVEKNQSEAEGKALLTSRAQSKLFERLPLLFSPSSLPSSFPQFHPEYSRLLPNSLFNIPIGLCPTIQWSSASQ